MFLVKIYCRFLDLVLIASFDVSQNFMTQFTLDHAKLTEIFTRKFLLCLNITTWTLSQFFVESLQYHV